MLWCHGCYGVLMCCLCGYYRVLGVIGCCVDGHCGMLCLWVLCVLVFRDVFSLVVRVCCLCGC